MQDPPETIGADRLRKALGAYLMTISIFQSYPFVHACEIVLLNCFQQFCAYRIRLPLVSSGLTGPWAPQP